MACRIFVSVMLGTCHLPDREGSRRMIFSWILTVQIVKMCSFGLFGVSVGSKVCRFCGLTGELETILLGIVCGVGEIFLACTWVC
jgi:hypothetical protein